MSGALAGLRVLDLTRLLPGPLCTMWLGDHGADVVKIEEPGMGDLVRYVPPLQGSESSFFLQLNRNKRSVTLNLKKERGREVLRRMAGKADVLVEGFRPGVLHRLGLGFAALRKENPRLIGCSITGYGQDGPYRDRAGHDINYQALAGLLALNGTPEGGPVPTAGQVADIGGGALSAFGGILLALLARERTGVGQEVDISMLDGTVAWLTHLAGVCFATGSAPRRGEGLLSGAVPCYRTYPTRDGKFLALGAIEPKFWAAFCERIGKPEWSDLGLSSEHAAEVSAGLERIFRTRTRDEWVAHFADLDCCLTPVLEVDESLGDPQVRHRRMVTAMPHETLGEIPQIGVAMKLSGTPGSLRIPPPALGAHTDEVLREAGYNPASIEALRTEGVI